MLARAFEDVLEVELFYRDFVMALTKRPELPTRAYR